MGEVSVSGTRCAVLAAECPGVEVLELPAEPAVLCDSAGVIQQANAAMVELVAASSAGDLIGGKLDTLLDGAEPVCRLRRADDTACGVRVVRCPLPRTSDTAAGQQIVLLLGTGEPDATERSDTERSDTERRRLVEAQRLAKIGSWSYEVATGVVYRSDVLHEMYAEVGLVPGEDLLFNVHPADLPEAERVRELALHADSEETVELEVSGAVGDKVYLTRSRAELGASGAVVRLHGTIQDVAEQRMLERQRGDDRRRLSDAQRVARLGTWEWDPESDEIVWSDMLYELFGVSPTGKLYYSTYLRMVHPRDRSWVDERWRRLVADHRQVECEHRIIRSDGAERILRCHGAAVAGPSGRVLMVGTAQDITEQRAIQTRMQRSSQRFTDLVTVTPIGIGLFDESARVLDANDALCELLGIPLERLRGMLSEAFIQEDELAAHQGMLRTVFSGAAGTGTTSIPQRKMLTAAGEVFYCAIHVKLSVQDDGERFWIAVFSDVTEQRRAAEALRYQATHDDLTGLPNRAAVNLLLSELLGGDSAKDGDEEGEASDPSNIAVLFCDIDNFKRVNDSLGHDAGDELLIVLARRLEGGLGDGCTAARLSGDEFVIIC
ncbi:MAG: PAS domain S-box protein [Sciscionella sp.]